MPAGWGQPATPASQSTSKQEALWKASCKGVGEEGLRSAWADGKRGIPAQQSLAIWDCSCFTLLWRRPGHNSFCRLACLGNPFLMLDRRLCLGMACEGGKWLDWKPVCVVWIWNVFANPVRRWLCGSAWEKGDPATPGGTWETRNREGDYAAALPHTTPYWMLGKHQLRCLGSAAWLQRQRWRLV